MDLLKLVPCEKQAGWCDGCGGFFVMCGGQIVAHGATILEAREAALQPDACRGCPWHPSCSSDRRIPPGGWAIGTYIRVREARGLRLYNDGTDDRSDTLGPIALCSHHVKLLDDQLDEHEAYIAPAGTRCMWCDAGGIDGGPAERAKLAELMRVHRESVAAAAREWAERRAS